MIKVNSWNVDGIAHALYGMRHPLKSYDKADTVIQVYDPMKRDVLNVGLVEYVENSSKYRNMFIGNISIGNADMQLAENLTKAGTDHRKFLRQINVHLDITAPITWWFQFDTYKVGTTKNSTSRMHTFHRRPMESGDVDNFVFDNKTELARKNMLDDINRRMELYHNQENKNSDFSKKIWRSVIDDLPQGLTATAMWSGNYEVLRNIYISRANHKQVEFDMLRKFMREELPLSNLITLE